MAGDTRTLKVVVVGDSSSATRSIRDVGRTAQDTEKRMGGLKSIMAAGLAIGGAAEIGSFFKDAIDGAADAAKTTKILNNQINNLGPAGKEAFKGASEFADKFSQQIGVDDDDIRKIQAKLASFPDAFKKGSDGADGMQRSVKAAFDLQAIGIGSAESNIVGIGKAMNDPIKGMTALGKSGVSFSEAQKDSIKNYMKQGDLANAQKVLLQGIESNAKGAAEAGVSPMEKMHVAIQNTAEGIAGMVLPQLQKFASFVSEKILPKVEGIAKAAGPKISAAFKVIGDVAAKLGKIFTDDVLPAAQSMWAVVGPLLTQFGDMLKTVWDKVQPLKQVSTIFGGIKTAFEFVSKYKETFQTIAVGILAVVAAQKAWTLATTIWSNVTKIAAAVQAAYNAVMAMNPIGLIVLAIIGLVAAIAYAWTHFAGFRVFLIGVWDGIKAGALGLWHGLQAAWNGIVAGAKAVGAFFVWLWHGIVTVFNWLKAAGMAYFNVYRFIFMAIIGVVRRVVNFFIGTVWPAIRNAFNRLVSAGRALWAGFAAVFGLIKDKVSAVIGWVRDTAVNIISGAFNRIKGFVSSLWEKWRGIFDLIKSKVETVMTNAQTAFERAKDGIKRAWDKLSDIAKVPVNFVIETVYDNGIRKFWNAIAGKVGMAELPFIPKLAAGREIPSVPGISGDWVPFYGQAGEYVLNRKQVAIAGGRAGIETMFGPGDRSGASSGHYAGGGILGAIGNAGQWLKDKGTALVKGSLLTVAKPLIDAIKATIAQIPGTGGIADAVRKLPTNALDKMLAWIKPKDKAPAVDGLAGPIGAIGQIPAWVTAARDSSVFGRDSGVGKWLFEVVKAAGLASTNFGLFNPRRTATGNLSMHGYGRAADLPASWEIFNFFRSNYGAKMKELIFSPANGAQIWNGRNHMYTGITRSMHFNHVHAAYDSGGVLPPGTTVAHNNTGRNEYVFTEDQLAASSVTVNVTVQGNVTTEKELAESIATSVRNALLRKAARNGGKTGLI